MIKAVIFDFFGVVGMSTYSLISEKYNLTAEQNKQISDLHKAYDNGFIDHEYFLKQYADIASVDYNIFIKDFYDSEKRTQVSLPVLDFALELKSKGYKIGLLTNVDSQQYEHIVKPIASNFNVVLASFMVGIAKPETKIYLLVAKELGFDESECILIDDLQANCEGARSAGMLSIKFDSLEQVKEDLKQLLNY